MTRHGLWLLTLPALFACGAGSDGTTPDIQGDTVSLEIGVEGATLVSVDGQAALTVPANALPARTKISIRPVTTQSAPRRSPRAWASASCVKSPKCSRWRCRTGSTWSG